MKSSRYQTGISRKLVSAGVLGCLLAGCTVVGPTAIRSGRLAYNDAITETDNQQLLKTPALRDLNTNARFSFAALARPLMTSILQSSHSRWGVVERFYPLTRLGTGKSVQYFFWCSSRF